MHVDSLLRFSSAQALTATAVSTNVVDGSVADRDFGIGNQLYIVTVVTVALTDAGSDTTVTVDLQSDTADTFGSATKVQELYIIPALAAIGDTFIATINPMVTRERYLRLNYTMTNGSLSTGTVTSFITDSVQKWRAMAKSWEIDS